MKPPTRQTIYHIIDSLDWTGHVELGDNDKSWLAMQIAGAFIEDRTICGSCGNLAVIVVQTRLGIICEDCLEEATEQAEAIRETLENHE